MSSHHDWVDQTVKLHNATKPFAPENGRCLLGGGLSWTHPVPTKAEPDKRVCWLTDIDGAPPRPQSSKRTGGTRPTST